MYVFYYYKKITSNFHIHSIILAIILAQNNIYTDNCFCNHLGDYRNITGPDAASCRVACENDCYCAGAVFSQAEQMCWLGNGNLFNIGYPSEALHGTDRTSYLRNQNVIDYPKPPVAKKDKKWVKVLVPIVVILGALLVVVVMFCLYRNDNVRQKVQACCRRPTYQVGYPGDPPVKNERGVEAYL